MRPDCVKYWLVVASHSLCCHLQSTSVNEWRNCSWDLTRIWADGLLALFTLNSSSNSGSKCVKMVRVSRLDVDVLNAKIEKIIKVVNGGKERWECNSTWQVSRTIYFCLLSSMIVIFQNWSLIKFIQHFLLFISHKSQVPCQDWQS